MSNLYLNVITFLLTTLFYYLALKPPLQYSTFQDETKYQQYVKTNYTYLAIYVLLVIIVQFGVNSAVISTKCGGKIGENIGIAGMMTFLPWILIFGVLVVVLSAYPGFKTAFSDVVGYYYVSGTATKLLTDLLIHPEIETKINKDPTMTPEKKQALETAADAIIKITGNTSILINQIVPTNFNEYWNILRPLMKEQYKTESPETEKMKEELFKIVMSRDNVGEAMWYIYTGLLITSIVQLKINTRGCQTSPQQMQANYQQFLKEEQEAETKKQNASATYTVTT